MALVTHNVALTNCDRSHVFCVVKTSQVYICDTPDYSSHCFIQWHPLIPVQAESPVKTPKKKKSKKSKRQTEEEEEED